MWNITILLIHKFSVYTSHRFRASFHLFILNGSKFLCSSPRCAILSSLITINFPNITYFLCIDIFIVMIVISADNQVTISFTSEWLPSCSHSNIIASRLALLYFHIASFETTFRVILTRFVCMGPFGIPQMHLNTEALSRPPLHHHLRAQLCPHHTLHCPV